MLEAANRGDFEVIKNIKKPYSINQPSAILNDPIRSLHNHYHHHHRSSAISILCRPAFPLALPRLTPPLPHARTHARTARTARTAQMEWDDSSSSGAWSGHAPAERVVAVSALSGMEMALQESSKRAANTKMNRYPTKSARREEDSYDMFEESATKKRASQEQRDLPPRKSTMTSLPTERIKPSKKSKRMLGKGKGKGKSKEPETATGGMPAAGKTKTAPAPVGMPTREPWYVGRMDRKKCERLVRAGMPGDFLVRRSASSETEIICVNDFGEAANFAVSYVEGELPVLYARRQFNTLDDAVAHAIARSVVHHSLSFAAAAAAGLLRDGVAENGYWGSVSSGGLARRWCGLNGRASERAMKSTSTRCCQWSMELVQRLSLCFEPLNCGAVELLSC